MSLFKTIKGRGSTYESLDPTELNLEIKGAVSLEANNYFEAIQLFTQGKSNFHKNPYFYYLLGYARECLKDYDNAIAEFNYYLNKVPRHYNAYFRIGLCYQNSSRFEQALNYYNEAEKYFERFLTVADNEFKISQKDAAIDNYYNIPIEKIFNNRGLVKINLGDSQGGIKDCTSAILNNPDYSNPYFIRGIEYYKMDNKELAKKDLEIADRLGYQMAKRFLDKYF